MTTSEYSIFNDSINDKLIAFDQTQIGFLIEQWKTAVEYVKDLTNRRMLMNNLFMTGLSVLISGVLFGNKISYLTITQYSIIVIGICLLGIAICYLWVRQLEYYRDLISVKYDIIREMEAFLPAFVFTSENDVFYINDMENKSLSRKEKRIPMVFAVVFLTIIVIVGVPFLKYFIKLLY